MLTPNQELTVTIASLAHGGSGVGRFEDFVIFVPFTGPGDEARVRVTNLKKNYAEGLLLEIIKPSPHRLQPPCSVFGVCGGCQWQHVNYAEQLRQKQQIVNHALARIAKEEGGLIHDIIPSPKDYHYRNRVQFRTDGPHVGFYQKQSHDLVEFPNCLIAEGPLNEELHKIKEEVKNNPPGKLRKIEVAIAENSNAVFRSEDHFHGEEAGFAQVNTGQNFNLKNHISEILGRPAKIDRDNVGGAGNLLDLYCGNGNFSLPLNKNGWRVYGVDFSRSAISAAKRAANQDTFFSAADCGYETKKLAEKNRRFEVVLLDPPRLGADERLWPSLAKLSPDTIIYVSCNPSTFARDWARIKNTAPYKLVQVTPFDMFPQTHHVELVAVAKK